MLKYETKLKLSDTAGLRREIDQVWQIFQPDVEKGDFTEGIINVDEAPPLFAWKADNFRSGSHNFVFVKQPDGTWRLQDQSL